MLFRMRNEDEMWKLLTEVFPTGPDSRDGKVLRKGLGELSADGERRERNADHATPKRGAKEVRGKGGNRTSLAESTMNGNKNPMEEGVDPKGRGRMIALLP